MKRNEILGEIYGRRHREDDEGWGREYDQRQQDQMDREKRDFKRQELQHELGHERNNVQVVINGKPWKVFPGRGRADSSEEYRNLQNMKSWAAKKSAATGKKWEVHLTGADPTVSEVAPPIGTPEQGKLKSVDTVKKTATVTTPTGDKEVPMQNLAQDPTKPGSLTAQVDAADKDQLKPGAPVKVTTVAESVEALRKLAGI